MKIIDIIYYISVMLAAAVGIIRYKYLDIAMRALVFAMVFTIANELISYCTNISEHYDLRNIIFHIYNVIALVFFMLFFIHAIHPSGKKKLIIGNAILWPALGILNIIFLQPITNINSNILLLESSLIICLPLYLIYRLLKNDRAPNLFVHPHFQASILLLLGGSSTFFFWAFISVLYVDNWPYVDLIMDSQVIINIIIYAGLAATFFFYPKNMKRIEYN